MFKAVFAVIATKAFYDNYLSRADSLTTKMTTNSFESYEMHPVKGLFHMFMYCANRSAVESAFSSVTCA